MQDGLSEWMTRKGFATLGELRGTLAVPRAEDEPNFERAGYVDALRGRNGNTYGPCEREPSVTPHVPSGVIGVDESADG